MLAHHVEISHDHVCKHRFCEIKLNEDALYAYLDRKKTPMDKIVLIDQAKGVMIASIAEEQPWTWTTHIFTLAPGRRR